MRSDSVSFDTKVGSSKLYCAPVSSSASQSWPDSKDVRYSSSGNPYYHSDRRSFPPRLGTLTKIRLGQLKLDSADLS